MFIKMVVLNGVDGEDIEIARTDGGALITAGNKVICEVRRDEDRDARYLKAREVAKLVYGGDSRGRPNATNSMVHDVWQEIDRIAGC
jgi:hypothetical protein